MAPRSTAATATDTAGEWEEIQPFTQPITLDEGQEIVALYLGGSEVEVPAGANDTDEGVITLESGKRIRRAMLHEFQNEGETEPFGVWGSAVLDKRLAEVPANTRVKIRYDGKQELDGGRTARRYRVWQDKSAKF